MYQIPSSYENELSKFRAFYSSDEKLKSLDFKIFRIVHGVYEQRNKGRFMVRIRCAAGVISKNQFDLITEIVNRYSNCYIHITSRQELQLHNILLNDVPDILDKLLIVGLSTKGSGGNTVRNIIASEEAGISKADIFDVIPYNIALTNYLTSLNTSFELPRKLKIAFSSSSADSGLARFNDLGFIAKIRDGQKGFSVYLGGSAAVNPFIGIRLYDFISDTEIFRVAHAVVNFFHAEGNRKNRNKARLRYLFFKYGEEEIRNRFQGYYSQLSGISIPEIDNPFTLSNVNTDESKISASPFIEKQVQDGFYSIKVPVFQGNLNSEEAKGISKIIDAYKLQHIHFTLEQNIRIRNIPHDKVDFVFSDLEDLGFNFYQNMISSKIVACTGADTCQLGLCLSKGSLQAIHQKISKDTFYKDVRIKISGCPNSCGQHMLADLGFSGKISKKDRLYPSYKVYAGGMPNEKAPHFAEQIGTIAAKDIHSFTHTVLKSFSESNFDSFHEFSKTQSIKDILQLYSDIPLFEENEDYYFDWGDNELFTSTKRKKAECSVGLLDMIEDNLDKIEKYNTALQAQQSTESHILLSQNIMHAICDLLCHFKKHTVESIEEREAFVRNEFLKANTPFNQYIELFDLFFSDNFQKLKNSRLDISNLVKQTFSYYANLNQNLEYSLPSISAMDLHDLLKKESTVRIIDIREDWEKERADIGGERITAKDILESNNYAGLKKDEFLIFYCRTGVRTADLLEILINRQGFTKVKHLEGGIHAWSDTIDSSIEKY